MINSRHIRHRRELASEKKYLVLWISLGMASLSAVFIVGYVIGRHSKTALPSVKTLTLAAHLPRSSRDPFAILDGENPELAGRTVAARPVVESAGREAAPQKERLPLEKAFRDIDRPALPRLVVRPADHQSREAKRALALSVVVAKKAARATKAAHPAKRAYTVQVKASKQKSKAFEFLEYLRQRGYRRIYVTKKAVPGKGVWWRVRIGRFDSIKAADRFRVKFQKAESMSAFVTPLR